MDLERGVGARDLADFLGRCVAISLRKVARDSCTFASQNATLSPGDFGSVWVHGFMPRSRVFGVGDGFHLVCGFEAISPCLFSEMGAHGL